MSVNFLTETEGWQINCAKHLCSSLRVLAKCACRGERYVSMYILWLKPCRIIPLHTWPRSHVFCQIFILLTDVVLFALCVGKFCKLVEPYHSSECNVVVATPTSDSLVPACPWRCLWFIVKVKSALGSPTGAPVHIAMSENDEAAFTATLPQHFDVLYPTIR